ncbi:conjugal transfer protein TraX [Pseudomonas sichuanensis]|uniref:TraX family protein n=1 Tax=Pseudomonas sichuanensis TaxID=2213015 RepID=UPI00244AB6F7|nr:TraX family protein [Pseudomonas sichuanensis]MDH0731463.1 conjugal transfer protein TraX [Pseudomonas sichuanensis]MDH1584009.1 conjugal transfer protein TraX [Pseudomonas sichuanensis]MDH1591878.1 conjugal transfer protein TraX [Pseudomonas sichuanensis]MDH1597348.1 conjugal transfer protein TraX [Pseudomonas sichuanensis]
MTSSPLSSATERHAGQDLIKWVALFTMVLDHMRLAWPTACDFFVLGRLSFPLFCLAVAINVSRHQPGELFTRSNGRYLALLVLFAALSEIPYRLVSTSGTFNVLVTLALGLLVAWGVQHRTLESLILAGGAILAAYLLNEPLMYGFYGVLVPAALVLAIKRPELFALLPVALCVASNSRTGLFEQAARLEPFAIAALLIAALAPLLGLALFWAQLPFKVLPVTRWSYWFYPGHLVALLSIRNLL